MSHFHIQSCERIWIARHDGGDHAVGTFLLPGRTAGRPGGSHRAAVQDAHPQLTVFSGRKIEKTPRKNPYFIFHLFHFAA